MTHALNNSAPAARSSNPTAGCLRIKSSRLSRAYGQRRHDFRKSRMPAYVDETRSALNRTLVEPRSFPEITGDIDPRRAAAGKTRKRKSDAGVVMNGVIGFGAEAQKLFATLPNAEQDAAFLDLAEAVAQRLSTRVECLVVHCDESAVHAHVEWRAYTNDGEPVSALLTRLVLSELQDITCDVLKRHCPGITRGNRKRDRLAAGAKSAEVINKSVRELHEELPAAIEAKRAEHDELEGRIETLEETVKDLAAAEHEARERLAEELLAKRAAAQAQEAARMRHLAEEEERLRSSWAEDFEARQRDLAARDAELRELATVTARDLEQERRAVEQLHADAVEAKAKMQAGVEALRAIGEEIGNDTLRFDGCHWRMRDPDRIKHAPRDLMLPLGQALKRITELQSSLRDDHHVLSKLRSDIEHWLGDTALAQEARAQAQDLVSRLDEAYAGPSGP